MTAAGLTKAQKRALDAIRSFINKHGYAPTFDELRKILNYRSKATVARLIGHLERRGHLTRETGQSRSMALSDGLKVYICRPVGHGNPVALAMASSEADARLVYEQLQDGRGTGEGRPPAITVRLLPNVRGGVIIA